MPHPVYGPPQHQLEVVTLRLALPTNRNGRRARLEAQGRSETQRQALWSVTESWTAEEHRAGLEPTDAAHHVLLCAMQDRPRDQYALERSLTGQGWEQLELPI